MAQADNVHNSEDITLDHTKTPKKLHKRLKIIISKKHGKLTSKNELIQTSITIKSEKLSEHLSRILIRNNLIDFVTGVCGIVTGVTLVTDLLDQSEKGLFVNLQAVFGVVLVVFSFYACIRVFTPNTKKLVNDIIETLYERKDYTAIVLMKAQIGGIPKLLVLRQENWQSYFLPYCHFGENDTDKSIQDTLKHELSHILEMPEHMFIIEEYERNPFYRIKRNVTQDAARLIQFRFYFVRLSTDVGRNRFMKAHFPQFSWKSKLELNQDIGTISNNGDVLSIIDQESLIQKTPYAFSDNLLSYAESDRGYRIIWTITRQCEYQCKMCATNSGSNIESELNFEQKQKVLMNLASINLNIESLDISGGDPLLNTEDQKIIRQCYHLLPFTKISVTTTAAGLDRIPLSELSSTVRNCDITYDIPCKKYEGGQNDKQTDWLRPYVYNKSNYDKLLGIRETGAVIDLNVHVPIHAETTNCEDIESLLADLERIHPKSIKFIRLMPVGRLGVDDIKDYKPETFMDIVDSIVHEKQYDFSISVSCALKTQANLFRGNKARSCPMLDEKLGIGSNGDVFACMWAAYLPEYKEKDVTENPFYLGCLLNEPLDEIIKRSYPKVRKLKEDAKNQCPVIKAAEDFSKRGVT